MTVGPCVQFQQLQTENAGGMIRLPSLIVNHLAGELGGVLWWEGNGEDSRVNRINSVYLRSFGYVSASSIVH